MPINGSTPSNSGTTTNSGSGVGGRTTFRPPWVKEGTQTTSPAASWRKPSLTTPAASDLKKDKVDDVKKVGKLTPTENGQPKEVTTKLQSKEIKVPIMTEKTKPATTPLKPKEKEIKVTVEKTEEKPKSTLKTVPSKDPKEKDVKNVLGKIDEKPKTILKTVPKDTKDSKTIVEKIEEKPKPILKSALKSDTKDKDIKETPKPVLKTIGGNIKDTKEKNETVEAKATEKVEENPKANLKTVSKVQKEISHPEKFIRPVLRKVSKVEDQIIKDIETKIIPFVILKPTPKIEQKEPEKSKIEPVILQKPKIEPKTIKKEVVTIKNGVATVRKMSDNSSETDSDEYEEVTETEEEESEDESESAATPAKLPDKTKINKAGPPPPPPPPGPPMPPPPPPSLIPPTSFEKKPLTAKRKQFLEKLKTRPRRRPDWSEMMQEVEQGKKLKHVKCNDRSNPILTSKSMAKVQGQYIYETEKASKHNQLLHQIQSGVKLKTVKTNDRSKPVLEGLRKFRRQMTIEEQIQKSESRAQLNEAPPEEELDDEMDDIDKLRDDLQSTKQLLSTELRNNEAQERENKRLLARVNNLEAELERERWTIDVKPTEEQKKKQQEKQTVSAPDETLVQSLKEEAIEAQKTSKLLEKKFQDTADQLDKAKSQIDEQKRQIAALEKKLTQAITIQEPSPPPKWNFSYVWADHEEDDFWGSQGTSYDSRRHSEAQRGDRDSSPEMEPEVSESDEEEDEEKKAERRARRLTRDVKLLSAKLFRLKEKQKLASKERASLRDAMKKNQVILKEEKKKYKKLQREVDKMAALMKDDCDDDDEEKEEVEDGPDEEAEEEESEEESDSEESEGESDAETASESEAEDAPNDKKKENLEPRVKRHEGRFAAIKKGNYLLQANVDGLLDEINKTREMSATLQSDLNSVLSELG